MMSSAKSGRSFGVFAFFLIIALAVANRPEKCFLPVEEGNCGEQILRWFFNIKSGHCETFVYSGCGGNANNFNSTMYCLHACNGTAANTHSYSLTTNLTEKLAKEDKSENTQQQLPKSSIPGHVIRSKRSSGSKRNNRKRQVQGASKKAGNASTGELNLKDILAQLSSSLNVLERIVDDGSSDSKATERGQNKAATVSDKPQSTSAPENRGPVSAIRGKEGTDEILRQVTKTNDYLEYASGRTSGKQIPAHAKGNGKPSRPKKPSKAEEHGAADDLDRDEEQRNLLDFKIRNIINDPSYVFSCKNISERDLAVLKEAVFEMDSKALRLTATAPIQDNKATTK